MKFINLLYSPNPSPSKWKIPVKKRWVNISYKLPKTTPKELFWQMMYAPSSSYFKVIGSITILGVISLGVQFYYVQYKIRTGDYCRLALKTMEKFPQLTNMLGPPLKNRTTLPYVKNGVKDDEVYLRMPIIGKKSRGVLYFHAVKDRNIWVMRSMKFEFTDRAGGVVRLVKDLNEE